MGSADQTMSLDTLEIVYSAHLKVGGAHWLLDGGQLISASKGLFLGVDLVVPWMSLSTGSSASMKIAA